MDANYQINAKFDQMPALHQFVILFLLIGFTFILPMPENVVFAMIFLISRAKYQADKDREDMKNGNL